MTNYWILLLRLTIHSQLLSELLLARCQCLHRFNIVQVGHPTWLDINIYVNSSLHATFHRNIWKKHKFYFLKVQPVLLHNHQQKSIDILSLTLVCFYQFGSEGSPFRKTRCTICSKTSAEDRADGNEGRRGRDECNGFKLYDGGGTLNKSKISQVLTGRDDETRVFEGLGNEGKISASSYASIPSNVPLSANEFSWLARRI